MTHPKSLLRQFKKLKPAEQERFIKQLGVFMKNPYAEELKNHPLQGKYKGMRSINVGGNLRAIYRHEEKALVIYELIGTHSQLYG